MSGRREVDDLLAARKIAGGRSAAIGDINSTRAILVSHAHRQILASSERHSGRVKNLELHDAIGSAGEKNVLDHALATGPGGTVCGITNLHPHGMINFRGSVVYMDAKCTGKEQGG